MSKLIDEELVTLVRQGDMHAECLLYHRYYGYSKVIANSFVRQHNVNIDYDELVSVAFSCVPSAVNKYSNIASFKKYWTAVAKNAMADYVKQNSESLTVSLDSLCYCDNDKVTFHDVIGESENPVANELDKIIEEYIYDPNSNLTDKEALVAHYLYYRQYDIDEIIVKTGWVPDQAYYTLRRTRKKISDYLKKRIFN